MADPQNYWFVRRRGVRGGYPTAWQGWAWLAGVFALELVVTRELQGVARVLGFFAVLSGFAWLAWGKTRIVDGVSD